jgi:hypothetical protein
MILELNDGEVALIDNLGSVASAKIKHQVLN